jgi:DNA polymerase-3 subunit beta
MRFSLQREVFLKPLAQVVNVVERRQTLPVLANLLVQVKAGQLSLTGTDLEVEMVSRIGVDDAQDGETTIPARKLFEIVRALPDGSKVTVSQSARRSRCRRDVPASRSPPCRPTTSPRSTRSRRPSACACPRPA